MMSTRKRCPERRKDGSPCKAECQEGKDTCYAHAAEARVKREIEALQKEDLKYLELKKRQLEAKEEEYDRLLAEQAAGEDQRLELIKASIQTIDDLESLRQAELLVINGLIDETICEKRASAIAQLLKHQAELISKRKEGGDVLDPTKRDALIKISVEMSGDDCWELLSDKTSALKRLMARAEALQQPTVTIPYKVVEEEKK
jgi:hypothetical protein